MSFQLQVLLCIGIINVHNFSRSLREDKTYFICCYSIKIKGNVSIYFGCSEENVLKRMIQE